MTVELRVIRNDTPKRAFRRSPETVRVLPTIVFPIVEPLETVVVRSIEAFDRREWDSLFPKELEDWQYLRALERARLAGCEPVYFGVRSRGRLVAAVPAFVGRRALAEPWRARGRAQWRRATARRSCWVPHSQRPAGSASRRERLRQNRRCSSTRCCGRRATNPCGGTSMDSSSAAKTPRLATFGSSEPSRWGSSVHPAPRWRVCRCRAGRSRII